ncbi:MAG: hypothetical protein RLZZ623_1266, partial [Actinomycetota bacterium]
MTGGRDDGRTPDTEPVRRFVYDRLMSDTKNPLIDLAVGADSFDLSDPDFWLLPRDVREGAFHALRQQPTLRYFDEWDFVDSPFPKGDGYFSLVRH